MGQSLEFFGIFQLLILVQDDWFMLAATIIALANSTMTIISVDPAYQTGYHLCSYIGMITHASY